MGTYLVPPDNDNMLWENFGILVLKLHIHRNEHDFRSI